MVDRWGPCIRINTAPRTRTMATMNQMFGPDLRGDPDPPEGEGWSFVDRLSEDKLLCPLGEEGLPMTGILGAKSNWATLNACAHPSTL